MGDDDEPSPGEEPRQHADEALGIRFVESGIDFIEHAKGARTAAEDRQKEGHAGERLLPTAEERDIPRLFARRTGDDLDPGVEDVRPLFEHDVGLSAAKELAKQLLKMTFDGVERFAEQPATVGVDLSDDLLERSLGFREILKLAGQRLITGLQLVGFEKRI